MPEATKAKRTRKGKTTLKTSSPKVNKDHTKRKDATGADMSSVQRSESGQRLLTASKPKLVWYKPATWRYRQTVPEYKPLPEAYSLFRNVVLQLWTNKKLFGGIVLTYGVLDIVLVRGFSSGSNLASFKSTLDHTFTGSGGKLASSVLTLGYLLSGSGSGGVAQSDIYQSILLLICSLAIIWALRQVTTGRTTRVRDTFYRGMYPLIPFFLLVVLIGAQLLPLAIGGGLYNTVMTNGIAVHAWEKVFWLLLFIGLGLWSLYMITASVFALYIVTLPNMTPLRAYRSAKQLVYGRRLLIWRKIIFLPIVLILLAAIVGVPLIFFAAPLALWVFFALGVIALPVVHSYLYNLYRGML
jgi:hypothetical protein